MGGFVHFNEMHVHFGNARAFHMVHVEMHVHFKSDCRNARAFRRNARVHFDQMHVHLVEMHVHFRMWFSCVCVTCMCVF